MKKIMAAFAGLLAAGRLLSGTFDGARLDGSTAKDLIGNISLEKIQPDGSVAELGGHPGRLMVDSSGNNYIRIVQEKPGTMTRIYRKHDISGGYDRLAVSL